jgi:hypothetical protein
MSLLDDDARAVMTNPVFDLIVIRPLAGARWDPDNGVRYTWETQNFRTLAAQLYAAYGDQRKTVILSNCEGDWQVGDCRFRQDYVPSWDEQQAFLGLVMSRQAGIRHVRESHPGVALRVFHNLEVCRVLAQHPFEVVRDIIPRMPEQPDFVSLSAWMTLDGVDIDAALDYMAAHDGLARHRHFIGEIGMSNDPANPGAAHDYIRTTVQAAIDWGCCAAFGWMWRAPWADPQPGCVWVANDGTKQEAYRAGIELQSVAPDPH